MGREGRRTMRWLLLAAVLLAPSALAQGQIPVLEPPQFSAFLSEPGGFGFMPGEPAFMELTITYTPPRGGRGTPAPTAERPENVEPTRITLAVKTQPAWFDNVTFDPPEVFAPMGLDRVSSASSHLVHVIANVSPFAPANERAVFQVTATAEPNGNVPGATAETTDDFRPRARVVGKLNVTAEPSLVLPGGRWNAVPFTVRNEGNSPIVAKINVTVRPENSQVSFSETLQLAHNETKVVDVRMRVPWTNAEFGTLELEAVPIVDGEEGEPARAEISVRGESAVPFPSALLVFLLAALLGQARGRHGRRGDR